MIKKFDWDLESLLRNKTIDDLYKQWYTLVSKQCQLVNSFWKDKKTFHQWLSLDLQTTKVSNRLTAYIFNHNNEDLSNSQWIAWMQKLNYDTTLFAKKLSNYNNNVIKNKQKITSYLKDKSLALWKREFNLIWKTQPHILSDQNELLLTKLSADSNAIYDIYTSLTDADLHFDNANDKKGLMHKINTLADANKLLKHTDRILRKNTWININKAFSNIENTLTKTLFYNYLRANQWAKARNYKSYIDAVLFNEEINEKIILNLYKNVKLYKTIYQHFSKKKRQIIKKMFNIKKVEPWDLNLELTKKPFTYSIAQAKEECLQALSPLGQKYTNVVKMAFNENWISWLPKAHKMSGAYSIDNTYGLDKNYILTNFNNTMDAVSTIAHEIGHSVNSYFINKKQNIYAGIDAVCGEIPSIVNEMLLNFYWLKKYQNNPKKQLPIYESMLSTFFGCTTIQIVFSEFEYQANKIINAGQPFTIEFVKKMFLEIRKQYGAISDEAIRQINLYPYNLAQSSILRIPHFYANNFYVYKYALGQVIAIVIASEINNGNKQMINNYFNFLSIGCAKSPINILKIINIDLNSNYIYLKAKKILTKLVSDFQRIKI